MDPAMREQLVERVWLLERLRDEAKAQAQHATREAQRARESAAEAGQRAAAFMTTRPLLATNSQTSATGWVTPQRRGRSARRHGPSIKRQLENARAGDS